MTYNELKALLDADKATPADVDAYMAASALEAEALAEAAVVEAAARHVASLRGQARIAHALAATRIPTKH